MTSDIDTWPQAHTWRFRHDAGSKPTGYVGQIVGRGWARRLVTCVDRCNRYLSGQQSAKQLGYAVRYEQVPRFRFHLGKTPPARLLNIVIRLAQGRIYAEVPHSEHVEP